MHRPQTSFMTHGVISSLHSVPGAHLCCSVFSCVLDELCLTVISFLRAANLPPLSYNHLAPAHHVHRRGELHCCPHRGRHRSGHCRYRSALSSILISNISSAHSSQVLLSFIVTAGLAVILSAVITFHELRRRSEAKVLRKLLLSLSDQQIITGIGIQSVGLAKMQTMVPYHFFIIWMLSLLATSTHLATLLALVNDFRRDWVLRWLRQFLMFINLVLSSVFGIFILMSVMKDLKPTLPIACVWELPSHGAASNSAISVAGTIATLTGNGIVFALGVWYLHSQRQKWLKMFQTIGLIVLIATGAGAAVRVILLSQAFGKPNLTLVGTSESDWSFGQLLPMLLLLLPLVSAIEIIRGMCLI